jgi:predicted TIM-barrel fold metal-dependent hydrolase
VQHSFAALSVVADVTQSTSAGTFAALSAIASADHLLFGSDVPFAGQPQIDVTLTEMRKLDVKNLDGINRENAWALLRRRG